MPIESKMIGVISILLMMSAAVPAQDNCPKACKCLNEFFTVCTSVPEKFINQPQTLYFRNAQLVLTADSLKDKNLENLDMISITNSTIDSIDFAAFKTLTNLRYVTITNCTINADLNVFNNVKYLYALTLTNNFLNSPVFYVEINNVNEFLLVNNVITKKITFNLTSVIFASFEQNDLKNIGLPTFKDWPYLEEINLADNKLEELSEDIFHANTEISDVNVANNYLKNTNGLRINTLYSLNVSHNNFITLERDLFKNLTSLKTLDLSYNQIATINPDTFEDLKNLEYLHLTGCGFKTIDFDYFPKLGLKTLNLNNNLITGLISPKDEFNTLLRLNLNNNFINQIPSDLFVKMQTLITLNLNHNQISDLSNVLWEIHDLITLDVSNNNISSIDKLLNNDTMITRVDISHNQIDSIDGVAKWSFVQVVDASFNEIASVPMLPNLILNLDLSNNNICDLSLEVFKKTWLLSALNVKNNPLNCSKQVLGCIKMFIQRGVDTDVAIPGDVVFSSFAKSATNEDLWNDIKNEVCRNKDGDEDEDDLNDELPFHFDKVEDDSKSGEHDDPLVVHVDPGSALPTYHSSSKENVQHDEGDEDDNIDDEDWKLREKMEKINEDPNQDDIDEDNDVVITTKIKSSSYQMHWYSLALLFLAVIITLLLLHLIVLMYCKRRAGPPSPASNLPYTQLHNEVYKRTTVEIERDTAEKKTQLEKIFTSGKVKELLYNFGHKIQNKEETTDILKSEATVNA